MRRIPGRWVSIFATLVILAGPQIVHADEVTDWNQTMLRAALLGASSPTATARVAGLVHAAIYDAANGVYHRYTPIFVDPAAPGGASARAAAVQAAYVILSRQYGGTTGTPLVQQGILNNRRTVSLLEIIEDEGPGAVDSGVAWGQTVADAIWALLPDPTMGNFPDGNLPGQWRRTLNLPAPGTSTPSAGYLSLSTLTPWTMDLPTLISQFRPDAPPSLTSDRYTRDFNEVKKMGSYSSAFRTADQTVASLFWNSTSASYLWNGVALRLLEARYRDEDDDDDHDWDGDDDSHRWHHGRHGRHGSLLQNARFFGRLNVAISDAMVGCWDAKYAYAYWRPVTAIHLAADDGNPFTEPDTTWSPLFTTPSHPEYPSGHSCLSGAAATVLADEFGERTRFTVESDTMIGEIRSFRSFRAALEEVKNARIFAGIHFRTACEVGTELGANIARFILENKFQRVD